MANKIVDVTLRLVDQVTSPLKIVNNNLEKSCKQWQRAGREISKTGRNIERVGSSLTRNVTMPIAGVGAASVKLAADFEQGMSKVQSISGATASDMEKLTKKALEMGGKTKFSAREASDAFSYMAMAGWKTSDMLNGIEGIMYLAGAAGEDLAQTSDIVTDAITAFGMSAKDSGRFADVLAAASSNANTNVSMMGETFKYVAPVAGALKYSIEDTSLAIGLMANAGIKSSQAGTAMRTWLANMSAPTGKVANTMKQLGISLTDAHGNMKSLKSVLLDTRGAFSGLSESQKTMAATALAGKEGMSGLLAIVNSSDKDFYKLANAIDKSEGACKKMYKTANNNLSGQLTELKSSVESLAIQIGDRLAPMVAKVTGFLQNCSEKFNNLSDGQKDVVVRFGLFAASIGPVMLVVGKLTQGIGSAITNVGKLVSSIKKAGSITALITSPAGIVVSVLAGVVAAGILVIKNWEKIKKAALSFKNFVGSKLRAVGLDMEFINKKIAPVKKEFAKIGAAVRKMWNTIKPPIKALGNLFISIFKFKIGTALKIAGSFMKNFISTATQVVSGITTALNGLINFIAGVFTGNWSRAWEGVKSIFRGAFNSLVGIAKAPINAVISLINGAISGINSISISIPKWVPKFGGNTYSPSIATIPTLARGTNNWGGGIVQISERGGEIVDLPSGSRVYPHDKSVRQAFKDGANSGKVVINKLAEQIVVREDADIDRIVDKLVEKLEKISKDIGGVDYEYLY